LQFLDSRRGTLHDDLVIENWYSAGK
jgi:hypothetical protein